MYISEILTRSNGATPMFCQKALAKEIENLTKDMLFEDATAYEKLVAEEGERVDDKRLIPMKKMQVYCQNLPIPRGDAEDDGSEDIHKSIEFSNLYQDDAFLGAPWCNVRIDNWRSARGGENPTDGKQTVRFAIIFCIYSQDWEKDGHEVLLNLMQLIYQRFTVRPLLDSQYQCHEDFTAEIAEEDTYPYFFGCITVSFDILGMHREEGVFY